MMRIGMMIVGFGVLSLPGVLSAQEAGGRASARVEVRAEARAEAAPESGENGAASAARADGEARMAIARRAIEGSSRDQAEAEHRGDDRRRQATRGEVEAGAAALGAGATVEDIARVRESTPPRRSMEASLRALATLTARGIASGHAAAAVSAQLARGASDAALTRMAASARTASHLNAALTAPGTGAAAGLGVAGTAAGSIGGPIGVGAGVAGAVTGGIRF
jgi:hypothetical protein